jgi:hypothetical protein
LWQRPQVQALLRADVALNYVDSVKCFGRRFKRTVVHGALPPLLWVRQRSDRS